jgi:hypothetical protein
MISIRTIFALARLKAIHLAVAFFATIVASSTELARARLSAFSLAVADLATIEAIPHLSGLGAITREMAFLATAWAVSKS